MNDIDKCEVCRGVKSHYWNLNWLVLCDIRTIRFLVFGYHRIPIVSWLREQLPNLSRTLNKRAS